MTKKMKTRLLMGALALIIPASGAIAATTTIEATAQFLNAIVLGNEVDMDFDLIEFSAAPAGGDTASLGTNGNIAYAGNFTGAGTGIAGEVEVTTGTVGQVVEIFCDSSGVLTDGAGASINVTNIEVDFGAGSAFGGGAACNGVAGAAADTLTLAGGGADVVLFGGRLDGATAAAFVAGNYSTANAGGDNIQVDVFYQ